MSVVPHGTEHTSHRDAIGELSIIRQTEHLIVLPRVNHQFGRQLHGVDDKFARRELLVRIHPANTVCKLYNASWRR